MDRFIPVIVFLESFMIHPTESIDKIHRKGRNGFKEAVYQRLGGALWALPSIHLSRDDIGECEVTGRGRAYTEWQASIERILEQPFHGKIDVAGFDLKERVVAAVQHIRLSKNTVMIAGHKDLFIQIVPESQSR
jgi:hypothetical protein